MAFLSSLLNNTQHNTLFDFKPTDVDTVSKLVNKINIKKATGVDQMLTGR
jgi:hypothetical protein